MTSQEHRKDRRLPFRWPVAIVLDATVNRHAYVGVTLDLSLAGCSVLTEHNVFSELPVTLHLSLPAVHAGCRLPPVEIKARMVYTVLAAGPRKFRCGIQFLKFRDNDRATLKRAIEDRAPTDS